MLFGDSLIMTSCSTVGKSENGSGETLLKFLINL